MSGGGVLLDPQQLKLLKEYRLERPLTSCHWDVRSRYVFCGAEDYVIHRVAVADGVVTTLVGHDSWVRAFGSSPDGEVLYSGGYDGRLMFWPVVGDVLMPMRVIEGHRGWIRGLAVSGDGRRVATCGNDRLVKEWDGATGQLLQEYSGHGAHVYNVQYSLDGARLYSCDLKGVVHEWRAGVSQPRVVATVSELHGYDTTFRADIGGARSIALHSDGRQLGLGGITRVSNAFAGVGEIVVAVLDVMDGKLRQVLGSKDRTVGTTWGLSWHRGGYWIGLTGGGGGGWLYFWRGDAADEFFRLKLPSDGRGVGVSTAGSGIAVAHADGQLRLYGVG